MDNLPLFFFFATIGNSNSHRVFACHARLLHVAALWDNAELLEDLLNGDELACLDARDSWGRTAMHAAATNADSKCLRILLQSGAKVDWALRCFIELCTMPAHLLGRCKCFHY